MAKDKDALESALEALGEGAELVVEESKSEREFFTDPIFMEDEYIDKFIQSEEFKEGLKIGAKYAGVYTAMVNSGADVSFAQDIAFNVQMSDIALANGQVQKEIASITSKNIRIEQEKSQL
jgi:hypothetical protein